MFRRLRSIALAAACCLLGLVPRAFALAFEYFGNDPIPPGYDQSFGPGILALGNLKSRIYWYEVNGDPFFYYRGDTTALNEALRKFAELPTAPREVILLPGPAERDSLTRERRIAYDWSIHSPSGLTGGGPPTMTVFVTGVAPARPPDAAALSRWIADLDSDSFVVRDRACRDLERLEHSAAPALRNARNARVSAEAGRRIDLLLSRLSGIDLQAVEVPAGLSVLTLNDLLARHRAGLKSSDPITRGLSASALAELNRYVNVVPDLVGFLGSERHEYARRSVAGALSRLGKKATPALADLKAGLKDPDVNVRNAFDYAVNVIEGAKDEKPTDDPAKLRSVLDGIDAFCRKSSDGPKK